MDVGPEIAWFAAGREEEMEYKRKYRALAPDALSLARMTTAILREADTRGGVVSKRHKDLKARAEMVMRVISRTGNLGDNPALTGFVPSADVHEWGQYGKPRLLDTMSDMAEAAAAYCAQLNAGQMMMIKRDARMSFISNVCGTALFPGIWSWRVQCALSDVFSRTTTDTRESVREWLYDHVGASPVWIARADDRTEARRTAMAFVVQLEADAYDRTPRETDGPFTLIMSDYIRQINEGLIRFARLLEEVCFAELIAGPRPLSHVIFM